jgi:porin
LIAAGFPVPELRHSTNQITATYLAHIRRGVFGSVGLAYTDHPSVSYFQGEGSALTLLGSLVIVF